MLVLTRHIHCPSNSTSQASNRLSAAHQRCLHALLCLYRSEDLSVLAGEFDYTSSSYSMHVLLLTFFILLIRPDTSSGVLQAILAFLTHIVMTGEIEGGSVRERVLESDLPFVQHIMFMVITTCQGDQQNSDGTHEEAATHSPSGSNTESSSSASSSSSSSSTSHSSSSSPSIVPFWFVMKEMIWLFTALLPGLLPLLLTQSHAQSVNDNRNIGTKHEGDSPPGIGIGIGTGIHMGIAIGTDSSTNHGELYVRLPPSSFPAYFIPALASQYSARRCLLPTYFHFLDQSLQHHDHDMILLSLYGIETILTYMKGRCHTHSPTPSHTHSQQQTQGQTHAHEHGEGEGEGQCQNDVIGQMSVNASVGSPAAQCDVDRQRESQKQWQYQCQSQSEGIFQLNKKRRMYMEVGSGSESNVEDHSLAYDSAQGHNHNAVACTRSGNSTDRHDRADDNDDDVMMTDVDASTLPLHTINHPLDSRGLDATGSDSTSKASATGQHLQVESIPVSSSSPHTPTHSLIKPYVEDRYRLLILHIRLFISDPKSPHRHVHVHLHLLPIAISLPTQLAQCVTVSASTVVLSTPSVISSLRHFQPRIVIIIIIILLLRLYHHVLSAVLLSVALTVSVSVSATLAIHPL